VRLEVWLLSHLKAKQFGGIVGEFLAALITPHRQTEINTRRRHEGIGLAQRDLVTGVHILMPMKFLVFTDHHPPVGFVLTPRAPCSHESTRIAPVRSSEKGISVVLLG
jgi:hypothetical protein